MARVPVLAIDRDTVLHRRDARAKLVLFVLLVAYLYLAPTWEWMLAMVVVGLGLAAVARVPSKRLGLLWLLQVPNLLGLVIIPAAIQVLGDGLVLEELDFGLKLGLAWSAALFVSITIFSTMDVDQMTDGLRGLRLPEAAAFTFGYAFMLLYTSVDDMFRIADALKIKGVELQSRNPVKMVRGLGRLMVPVVFNVVRRASTMMSVLEMRGFSTSTRRPITALGRFGPADVALVAAGVAVVGLAGAARFGLGPALR